MQFHNARPAGGGVGLAGQMSVSLTVCALHLCVVARLYEADVAQVKDASDDLQHLSLDVPGDPNHLHGFLETHTVGKDKDEPTVFSMFYPSFG